MRKTAFAIAAAALAATLPGVGVGAGPTGGEDPVNKIHTALIADGKVVQSSSRDIPAGAFSRGPSEDRKAPEQPQPAGDKVHPVLRQRMATRPGDQKERVVVTFQDDVRMPRFPEPAMNEPRDSETNKQALARAQQMVDEIRRQRAPAYEELGRELAAQHGAKALETFWLHKAVLAEMPLRAVEGLSRRTDVEYVEPELTGEKPPNHDSSDNDAVDGRARIVSDPYFNLGLTSGWIGLLDTGVRTSHTLFTSPDHIAFTFDCTQSNCSGGDPSDDCWNHGTSSAAIITGNANLGGAFRGVTGITLDSFKVYPAGCMGLSTSAVERGFQKAVSFLDRVIVAEMQSDSSETGAVAAAAEAAFDAGSVVIAANGNFGCDVGCAGTVRSPAKAHRVIGVGALYVDTLAQYSSQSRGPTSDNRTKPDIQAPSWTETAGASSDTQLKVFGGTSGATPYASGAAALLRNWLKGSSGTIDPGQVYAQLILSGNQPSFNNTAGAGLIKLPTNGYAWWGKVTIHDGETIDIPLGVSGAAPNTLDGALWWPESASGVHDDVDLKLVSPGSSVLASSVSGSSVFERARVSGSVASGTWKLRVRGFSVPGGSQTVYWAAHVRTS